MEAKIIPDVGVRWVDSYTPRSIQADFEKYPVNDNDCCPLFEELIAHHKEWSPRAVHSFHMASTLHLLSTVAAKRVTARFGSGFLYTDFYFILFGQSGVYTKSEVVKVGNNILKSVGLDFLRLPSKITPEALRKQLMPISRLELADVESDNLREFLKNRSRFAAQRSWYFDEFGTNLEGILRDGGYMAEMRGILRQAAGGDAEIGQQTISRGGEMPDDVYLTLIANATPMDFKKIHKHLNIILGDGLLGRFMIAVPDRAINSKRFPRYEYRTPQNIINTLKEWHNRLGIPEYTERPQPINKTILSVPDAVYDKFYDYDQYIRSLIPTTNEYIVPNYVRIAGRALRLAILLSSINGKSEVGMAEMEKAIHISELFRYAYHQFFETITDNKEETEQQKLIDYIITNLQKKGSMTFSFMLNRCRKLQKEDPLELQKLLKEMEKAGMIAINVADNGTVTYGIEKLK